MRGSVEDQVTVSGGWQLRLVESGDRAELTGPQPVSVEAPAGFRITETLIDGEFAVVVAEHEQAAEPNQATVIDLATGEQTVLDGDAEVPTTVGGTWALGAGLLVHATTSDRDYCLATVDLVSGRSDRGPCVPPRHGLTNARVTPGGVTVMTFDDSRPSCRTLNRVVGTELEPLGGVEECHGWEAVATETAAVWGVVANERQVDASEFFADTGSGPVEVGAGTTGTLVWCGDAAYAVRDPQRNTDPARLLRIGPDGSTDVVYESPGAGRAFLSAPRCGGTDLTVTAFTEAGDEQVTAAVG
ncbi:hypothetical protein [Nocardioides sp.]|uniref:hypothetical protein n=1 Tax=Nocardioides sp. TaxID=35761 RepID=UPI002ED395EC